MYESPVTLNVQKQLHLDTKNSNIILFGSCIYLADEFWSYVRRVAELSTHLQVTDAANSIPELCQAVGTRHQESHVGSDVVKLQEMRH